MEGEDILGVAEGYKHKTHRSHKPRTAWCPCCYSSLDFLTPTTPARAPGTSAATGA